MTPSPSRQRGIALMMVLWVLTLLTIIAIGMTAGQRTETALAANQLDQARFRALADAAIHLAVLNLTATPPPEAIERDELSADQWLWFPNGQSRQIELLGEAVEIAVQNETSLIDLNAASREQLRALLLAVAVAEEEVDALADAVLDWRDADDLAQLNGAEDPDYDAAGRAYGAKDGPFDSVAELAQVLGFDRALVARLTPALSVAGAARNVDLEFAPALVQAAVQGLSLEEVEQERLEQEAEAEGRGAAVVVARGGPVYRVRVARRADDGAGRSMEALIRLDAAADPPFRILWRRYGLIDPTDSAPGPDGEDLDE